MTRPTPHCAQLLPKVRRAGAGPCLSANGSAEGNGDIDSPLSAYGNSLHPPLPWLQPR